MTYYSVLEVTPTRDDWIAAYSDCVEAIVVDYGGQYLARTPRHERLEGQGQDPALRALIAWPTKEAALGFMNDQRYAPHLGARTAGSNSHHVLIAGMDEPA